ncbi:hypothetical protein D7Y31_07165 [Stenotrophomonas maltophilia]|nr:hypothetical protein [Stenotrophomonas maltophilia]MBA0344159.1 hypothetical protein [Stenotrophomonas maltophilia]
MSDISPVTVFGQLGLSQLPGQVVESNFDLVFALHFSPKASEPARRQRARIAQQGPKYGSAACTLVAKATYLVANHLQTAITKCSIHQTVDVNVGWLRDRIQLTRKRIELEGGLQPAKQAHFVLAREILAPSTSCSQ